MRDCWQNKLAWQKIRRFQSLGKKSVSFLSLFKTFDMPFCEQSIRKIWKRLSVSLFLSLPGTEEPLETPNKRVHTQFWFSWVADPELGL